MPCFVRVSGSLLVPVIVPLHYSTLVRSVVIVAEHCPVTSASTGATGGSVSCTTIRCVAALTLPCPSSKLQVTTEMPCVVRVSGSLVQPSILPPRLHVACGLAVDDAEH